MAAGFALLRLSPAAFWAMTPRELAAATGRLKRSDAPRRGEIDEMMRLFPDHMNTRSGHGR
jgi:uncharacterized phage protein (TIGR02216 family)